MNMPHYFIPIAFNFRPLLKKGGFFVGINLKGNDMKKILFLCSLLMISPTLMAEDTTVESCANGAGTIITGVITGTKYCWSNSDMNWWNANAWCDAQGKRLIDLNIDCGCDWSTNCNGRCPEFVVSHGWVSTPSSISTTYLLISNGWIYSSPRPRDATYRATCK